MIDSVQPKRIWIAEVQELLWQSPIVGSIYPNVVRFPTLLLKSGGEPVLYPNVTDFFGISSLDVVANICMYAKSILFLHPRFLVNCVGRSLFCAQQYVRY